MQHQTKELTIIKHPNNILELTVTKGFTGTFSLEEVESNLALLRDVMGNRPSATIINILGTYVKKDVLKQYADTDLPIVATAMIASSFSAKLVANIFLSMRQRFGTLDKRPTKIFTDKSAALVWAKEQVDKANNLG